jgi:peroxiredoxin
VRQNSLVNVLQAIQLGFAAVAAVGTFSFVRTVQDGELRRQCMPLCQIAPRYAQTNRRAPDFELQRLNAGTVRLSQWRGRAVILNFWSVSCTECKKELPSLAQLSKTLQARGGAALVTITPDESLDEVRNMLAATVGNDPPFEVLLDPGSRIIASTYGTKLYPETWFIDPDGIIRARIDGARDYTQPIFVDFAMGLNAGVTCDVEFARGQPRGENGWICDETES